MNKILIGIFFLCFVSNLKAQQNKKNEARLILGVADFTASTLQQKRFCNVVKAQVTDVLNKTNRFKLVDIDGVATAQALKKSGENYKSDNWIDANKSINAEYTLTAHIGNIKFIKLNGGKGYKATITYTLKIIHTESSSLVTNGTKTFTSSESEIMLTPETALNSAISSTLVELESYIKKSFPISVVIAKIVGEKKGKALILILDGGSGKGIEKGQLYKTTYMDSTMGNPYPVEIGKIRIVEVVNKNFSKAKVLSGGEKILKYFTSSAKIINELIE